MGNDGRAGRPYMHTLPGGSCYAISASPGKRKQRPDKCSAPSRREERESEYYCANACVAVAVSGSAWSA